jgi:predicted ATPase/class 3 adenylate cyclase
MPDLPRGTVTFLFTDIEGSTALWERDRQAMAETVARHIDLLGDAIRAHGGVHFKTVGDAVQAAFPTAPAAVAAALAGQQAILAETWPAGDTLRVRMALHAGEAEPDSRGDYLAAPLNRLARLLAAGHGGQILLTQAIQQLVRDALPDGATLHHHGEHELRGLREPEHIYQLLHPALLQGFPPLKTLTGGSSKLPRQPTRFLGREREVSEIVSLLQQPGTQLLTLTGPGGTGKTRLALQAAAELTDMFPDGVSFVPLGPVTDPTLVPSVVANALEIREDGSRSPAIAVQEWLRNRRVLLVLDNLEHLLAATPAIGDWLRTCAGLQILATSRAPLHLQAEHEYPVPPLGLPQRKPPPAPDQLSQYEAVQLFISRAQAVRPGFIVDNASAPAIAEICWRLDGLPLAIELAAARIRLLPPEALLARLEHRLTMLTGGARDLPARQRTLRNAIAWSHDLLDAEDRVLFARLSVFAGSFTIEAAERITSSDVDLDAFTGIEKLCEHSLLRQVEGAGGEPRFAMLETVREFAVEQLVARGEQAAIQAAHTQFFLELAESAVPHLSGPDERYWSAILATDQDNIRAALARTVASEPDLAARLVVAMTRYWSNRGEIAEARDWAERALVAAEALSPARRAELLLAVCTITFQQSDFLASLAFATQARDLFREIGAQNELSTSLKMLSAIAFVRGDLSQARTLAEESLLVARAVGDPDTIANALVMLADIPPAHQHHPPPATLFSEALTLSRATGNQRAIGFALSRLGYLAELQGDLDQAALRYQESLAIHRELGHRRHLPLPLAGLARIAQQRGDLSTAEALHQEAVELARAVGDRQSIASSLEELASVILEQGEPDRAQPLAAEGLALAREIADRWVLLSNLETAARVAEDQQDFLLAVTLHAEALAIAREADDERLVAYVLEGVARSAIGAGETTQAVRLLGAAETLWAQQQPDTLPQWGHRRESARLEKARAAAYQMLGEAQFDATLAAGRALTGSDAAAEAMALTKAMRRSTE